jgi:glycosyltransferase involved in cell wall biosynthesis
MDSVSANLPKAPQQLMEEQISLLMLPRYHSNGPSSRQRLLLYADYLAAQGVRLTVEPFFSEAYLKRRYGRQPCDWLDIVRSYFRRIKVALRAKRYDVVWIENEILPWLPTWFEDLLIGQVPSIVDFDDAWHLRYNTCGRRWWCRMLRDKLNHVAQRASVTTVANENLGTLYKQLGGVRVALLPTIVDLQHYPVTDEPAGAFTIGWIGTPLNLPYLTAIAGALRRLSSEGAKLLVIADGNEIPELSGVDVEYVRWSEGTEGESISRCHVGIMPLPDGAQERFKSAYKLIQYAAAGRPVIASPVGANLSVVSEGETGYFARTEEEWYKSLVRLRDDTTLRRLLGAAGRKRCEEIYSLTVSRERVLKLVVEVARLGVDKIRARLKKRQRFKRLIPFAIP